MFNWNTNVAAFKNKEERLVWRLNQLINFGLGKEKLNLGLVRKYWQKLHLDPKRKKFLNLILM